MMFFPQPIVIEVLSSGRGRRLRPEDGDNRSPDDRADTPQEPDSNPTDLHFEPAAWEPGDLLLIAPEPQPNEATKNHLHTVLQRLARGTSAKSKLWRIAMNLGHKASHPPAAEAEAAACLKRPGLDDTALTDWTTVPFITIDNVGSRDLDQALHVERCWPDDVAPSQQSDATSGFRVRYALADASYYIRPDSELFEEALRRGTSYYLPGIAIPMLPRSLSEGLISLNPREHRRSFVMDMRLDAEGRCLATTVVRARIRSRAKLTYPGVQAFYACGEGHPAANADYAESLRLLAEVGRRRMALARAADVVSFQRAEVDVQIDGTSFSLVADQRLPVERYNEQLSLLCNMEGARLISRSGPNGQGNVGQGIFKVHPAPPAEKLERLARTIDAVVHARHLDRDRWRWHRGREPLADYLDRLPRKGPQARIAQAIQRQAMMANVGSTFSDGPARHYGVGAPAYARFSAPMREIVGIFTHKEALEELGLQPPGQRDLDEALRERVIKAANQAHQRQSKLTKACNQLVLDTLLARELKMAEQQRWRTGTLLGMTASKLYLHLDAPPIEIKVYLRDLPQDGSRPRVSGHGGSFQLGEREIALGERIELRVSGRSTRSARWTFELRFPDQSTG